MKGRRKRHPAAPFRVYVVDGGKAARVRATGSDIERYEFAVGSQRLARPVPPATTKPSDGELDPIVEENVRAAIRARFDEIDARRGDVGHAEQKIRDERENPIAAQLRQVSAGVNDDGSPLDRSQLELAEIIARGTPKNDGGPSRKGREP